MPLSQHPAVEQFQALHSPAAERNKAPLLAALRPRLPHRGELLELACGALQHALHFAPHFPQLRWQPTEVDERTLTLAPAYAEALAPSWPANLALPLRLSATDEVWSTTDLDAIYLANLLHISPIEVCAAVFDGAARHLTGAGSLIVYGPFKQDGTFRSAGDAEFDNTLRQRNPQWGIRDLEWLDGLAATVGLRRLEALPMPANNLLLRYDRAIEPSHSSLTT